MKAKRFLYLAPIILAGCGPTYVSITPKPTPSAAHSYAGWQVAFERDGDIWTAQGDGSKQKLLIKNGSSPEWSPDGKRIAFLRHGSVVTANADGSQQRIVYRGSPSTKDDDEPSISWNGRTNEIVFTRPAKGGSAIFYSRGSETAVVPDLQPSDKGTTYSFSNNESPRWSPTGKYLAFARNGDIWLCQRNDPKSVGWGTSFVWDVTRLAATARFDAPVYRASSENVGAYWLSWSRDERFLAYGLRRLSGSGTSEIRLLHLKSNQNGLVDKAPASDTMIADGYYPAFCPDGQTLSFIRQSDDDGGWDLIVRQPDGKSRAILKNAWQPAWRPLSK